MKTVYVVNKSAHDFSAAKEFGELCFLSEGPMDRYAINSMHRVFSEGLSQSKGCDYIVPCSLTVMSIVCCSIFAHKHGMLNLLIYKNGRYIERNIVL